MTFNTYYKAVPQCMLNNIFILFSRRNWYVKHRDFFIASKKLVLKSNTVGFEDVSQCAAIKYQQINQSLLFPFVAFHVSNCIYIVIPRVFYVLLKVSRIVHSLRNVLAKLVWRGYLETWKTSYFSLKPRIYKTFQ